MYKRFGMLAYVLAVFWLVGCGMSDAPTSELPTSTPILAAITPVPPTLLSVSSTKALSTAPLTATVALPMATPTALPTLDSRGTGVLEALPTVTPLSTLTNDADVITLTPEPDAAPMLPAYVLQYESTKCKFDTPSGYKIECGTLIVPESRSHPAGPTVHLHVAVFKSTHSDPAPDPVIHLMGGPGGSPLDVAAAVLEAGGDAILEQRDYVLFSQRGTSFADPFLGCPGRGDFQWELAAQPLSLAERNVRNLEFWRDCHDALVAQGINLAAYTSAENAADVNDLRIALGYEQVNLYGISYGSRLALTVLRDYPEGIRSVIIDAIWPLQIDLDHDVALSAHRSIHALFDACAADMQCSQAYPDLETAFYDVIQDLNANPVSFQFERGTVVVDGYTFLETMFTFMYSVNAIPHIPAIITNAANGKYEPTLFEIQDRNTYAWGMHYSIRCHEELAFESRVESVALAADLPTVFVDFFADGYEYALCEWWQSDVAAPRENLPVVGDVPTLILSGYYDPITPPAYGQLVAETHNKGYFIEFPALSHGTMRSNACALDIGLAFLDAPTVAPDVSCLDDLSPLTFK